MKKSKCQSTIKSISLVFVAMFISLHVFAQKNSLKFGLVTEGRYNIEYENRLSSRTALSIGIQVYDYDSKNGFFSFLIKDVYHNNGVRLVADYKLFPFRTGLKGFYIAPNASIGSHNIKYKDWQRGEAYDNGSGSWFSSTSYGPSKTVVTKSKIVAGSIGFKIGYQINWDKFMVDLGFINSRNNIFSSKGISGGGVAESRYQKEINGNQMGAYIGFGLKF